MQVHPAVAYLTEISSNIALNVSPGYAESVSPSPEKSGRFPDEERASSASLPTQAERTAMLIAARQQHPCPHLERTSVTLPEQHPGFTELAVTSSWVLQTGSSPAQGRAAEG